LLWFAFFAQVCSCLFLFVSFCSGLFWFVSKLQQKQTKLSKISKSQQTETKLAKFAVSKNRQKRAKILKSPPQKVPVNSE